MDPSDFASELVATGVLEQIYRSLEPSYPFEGCGFVFARPSGELVHVPTTNRAQDLHELDPEAYPRDARTWFEPDMKPWLKAKRSGLKPRLIYHSHPDVGAYFSDDDQRSAVMEGDDGVVERHPGVLHMVVSVAEPGKVKQARLYAFLPSSGRFIERAVFNACGELVAHLRY